MLESEELAGGEVDGGAVVGQGLDPTNDIVNTGRCEVFFKMLAGVLLLAEALVFGVTVAAHQLVNGRAEERDG